MWYVYLLYNKAIQRTYIGCTTDPDRRLRQHNREIAGGARSTLKGAGHWYIHTVLSGFEDKSSAMRWEKILKLRGRGLVGRTAVFIMVAEGKCPPGKQYEVPKGILLDEPRKL